MFDYANYYLRSKWTNCYRLGIGAWAWGDKLFWNYGSDYGVSQVQEAFEATLDSGISFFDTAEVYGLGESESLAGTVYEGARASSADCD
jgi:aryl-alcohol dehydrogenase-like predicted oxidoreductase